MKFQKNLVSLFLLLLTTTTIAQRGYFDAPYTRYEADQAILVNAVKLAKSFNQADLQSEASGQICVNLNSENASVSWAINETADGLVVRFCVPDGQTGVLGVYVDDQKAGTLNLSSEWSWEYLATNGNLNNSGVVNKNPKMRFDEVRLKLNTKIVTGQHLKLICESGNIYLDFIETEPVPQPATVPAGAVVYSGNGSTLQSFIDANGGKTIFIPEGFYNIPGILYFGTNNTKLCGAGMWYTQLNFTSNSIYQGGLVSNAVNTSYEGLFLTTDRNSRSNSYKAINGIYTSGSLIQNIWAEHFECGAWIAQYNTGNILYADGFRILNCRFRNNYADGINLCKGTRNAIVEHCNFRNNGDDDMAIWSADGLECQNNTFRFNTSENCWRASGCAIYGGLSNKAHHLLIRDNLEAGLRVSNNFAGKPFNSSGMHEFSEITLENCGTMNDLYNEPVGAIDLVCNNVSGTRINNVLFRNIDILNAKNDAVFINKIGGEGFYNLNFEKINIKGTGKEYPFNNINNSTAKRGYGILFYGYPTGYAIYCDIQISDFGGNAYSETNLTAKGGLTWTQVNTCLSSIITFDQKTFNISKYQDKIIVSGLEGVNLIQIFNSTGINISSAEIQSEFYKSCALQDGIYLISVNHQVFKVLVNSN